MKAIVLIVLVALVNESYAWWCQGHRIGNIAYAHLVHEIAVQELLDEKKGDMVRKMNETIQFMKEHDASRPLDMIACWMDEIKDDGGMYWSGIFHYVDIPLIEDGLNITQPPDANVTGAIVSFASIG
eukprot:TRINITY_DN2296_c0_g1_i31.p1 TRINITY_DN2296_c0_g1~~TRINITY_DN2296_c0_g1_i31.p1  ORF type:complete len:127 (+),score=21.40 TRINITY_DN2296_c0_g1_i31:178-558(+)